MDKPGEARGFWSVIFSRERRAVGLWAIQALVTGRKADFPHDIIRVTYAGLTHLRLGITLLLPLFAGGVLKAAEDLPVIRIGVEVNSPPLAYVDAAGVPRGFTPELLQAMEATGIVRFEIVSLFWSQLLRKFNAGELDALANVQILAERRGSMEFSIHHAALHGVTYTRPGSPAISRAADFVGKKMATLADTTSQRHAVDHAGWGAEIVVLDSWMAMLQTVKDGECDFALVMRPLNFEQPDEMGLQRNFVDDLVHEYRIATHRGDHKTLERLNDALAQMQQSGIIRRLHVKWIGPIEPQTIRLVDLRPYYLPGGLGLILVLGLFGWQRWYKVRWRKLALKLQVSQDMLNNMGRIARVGGWELDLATQRVYWSDETCRLHGVERGAEPTVNEAINFYAPESRPTILAAVQAGMEHGRPWDLELEMISANGRRFWARAQGLPELKNGKVVKLSGAFQDITARKQAEMVLRQSLREKEALLREVHHRVKNNLQVITSLLRLETTKRTDPATKEALRDLQGRIRSMALLHETLYRTGNFAQVDLGEYLRDLGTQYFHGQNTAPSLVQLGLELSSVEVVIDQAIPCGLIVNELLSNALKYGFPEGRSGRVLIKVSQSADGEVHLQVGDDGVGLPPNLEIKHSKSLGLRLVSDLVRQLQGVLTMAPPAQFTIRFKPKAIQDSNLPLAIPPAKVQPEEIP